MIRKLLCLITCIIFYSQIFAQQSAAVKQKKHNIFFLKNNGRYVNERDSADYICVISEPDSGSTLYGANEFYKDGKQKFIGKSSKSEYLSPEGQCICYFPNGNKKSVEEYKEGKLDGICYYFYPNGKIYVSKEFHQTEAKGNSVTGDINSDYFIKDCIDSTGKVMVKEGKGHFMGYDDDFKYIEEEGPINKGVRDSIWAGRDVGAKITFTEQYVEGKLISGVSTDSTGVKYTYTQRMVAPQYKGGAKALYEYLGTHIRYPDNAKRNDVQGTVILGFVVKKDGTVKDVKVIKSADAELDKEALRVVNNSKGWQPAMYYGKPANIYYSIPINFALSQN